MSSNELKVVVAGDVTVDWYYWTRSPESNENINWKLYEGMTAHAEFGGAILFAKMLESHLAHHIKSGKLKVISQNIEETSELYNMSPDQILHTNIKLELFSNKQDSDEQQIKNGKIKNENNQKVYRVKEYYGYTTPKTVLCPESLPINEDKEDAKFVIIHDVGNGFRLAKNEYDGVKWSEKWPMALKPDHKPLIIYNMYPPLFNGDLWEHVLKYHKNNLILILNADDLRKLGANISRSLSWEKTALDFSWEIKHNKELTKIKDLPNVIVRFKNEGAIHYNGQSKSVGTKLYFNSSYVEGGSWDGKKFGGMQGTSVVFVSTVASELISGFLNNSDGTLKENFEIFTHENINTILEKGIKKGLMYSKKLLINGHGNQNDSIGHERAPFSFENICKTLFSDDQKENVKERTLEEEDFVCTKVPDDDSTKPDLNTWTILGSIKNDRQLESLAMDIVKYGTSKIKNIPKGSFGRLTTVDRVEIESFRSIMRILEEYINFDKTSRPLSIAVFGYPGSGKSFGITEIAKSIDPENISKIDFNVSQFTSIKDLTNAFYRIRDRSLEGKIPLVFFDEFDCKFEGQDLGWLKYFLAPMQDGKFLDNGNLHPIGRAIFVFAGGIYKNYNEFCEQMGLRSSSQVGSRRKNSNFVSEKCPDFVSRLRGYVNILGPNEINKENDEAYIIRRAIQLRSLLEEKIPDILKSGNRDEAKGQSTVTDEEYKIADIDKNILEALVKIPRYIHGVRSMEAIIDMSMFKGENSWQKSSLPSKDQLELHVDGTKFYEILSGNNNNSSGGLKVGDKTSDDGIVTNNEETEAYSIVKSIIRERIDVNRIFMRDKKSYYGILLDDNIKKPICRLYFETKQKYVGFFTEGKVNEEKVSIENLNDIYNYAEKLKMTVESYDNGKVEN